MALGPLSSDAVLTPEQRAARRAAANTPPPGTSIVGPTAGKKPLSFGTGNTFNVGEGQEVRLVDAGGNVIFSGSGVEGANQAVAVAQSLSDDLGKDANFKIQTGERTINPDGSVGGTRYIDVARAAPSQSGLGFLADNVLPFAASFIPGVGPILGAALGSAASSAAQGRGLEDALKRAAIAGGTAYLGGQVFGPATPGSTAPTGGVNSDLIPNALEGLNFGSIANTAIPAGVGGDIVALAARNAASNLAGSTVGGVLGQAVASQVGAPNQRNVVDGIDQDTGEIVVSRPNPIAATQGPGLGSALAGLPALTDLAMDPTLAEPALEDIVVSGNRPVPKTVVPDELAPVGSVLAGLGLTTPPTTDPALTENKFDLKDVLGTGLTLPQLLSIGGVGADLLKNLLAGDGGAGAGVPYVSPFGAGAGIGLGTGRDMRANPTILDYERYGFGPEAMFFQPGYGLLNSAAPAPAPQAPPIMATNPRYEPLI